MDLGQREKILIISVIGIVLLSAGLILTSNEQKNASSRNVEDLEQETEFILRANTSDIDTLSIETGYLSVDDMYTLDSPEIKLESETCLRFYNYSGKVDLKNKELKGNAEGFATCTLNGSIDITVDEEVDDMWKVSTRELENSRDFSFNASNLFLNPTDSPESINGSDKEIEIRGFEGKIELYPPTGINLFGDGVILVDGERI